MTFFSAYRVLLSQRAASRLAVSAIAIRLPTPLLSLGFLLTVQEHTGSYAQAGLLWTAYAAGYAIGAPVTGHLVGRKGPKPVLLGCLVVYIPAMTVIVIALFAQARVVALIPAAAVLGAFTPPGQALIRSSWAAVVPAQQLQSAYALDAVITESLLIVGPLLVSVLILFTTPVAAVIGGGACMVGGTVQLLMTPAVKEWRRPSQALGQARRRSGGRSRLPVLFGIAFLDIVAYGCLIVGVAAVATYHHSRSASGVLLSMMSVGVVIGGLVYGSRSWRGTQRAQLCILYAVGALILVVAGGFALGLIALGALFAVSGLIGGPRDTLLQLILGDCARPENRTAVFAWYGSVTWASYGLGTALGGQLAGLGHGTGYAALVAAGVGDGFAALTALLLRPAGPVGERVQDEPLATASTGQPASEISTNE
jgi:MFS family permease